MTKNDLLSYGIFKDNEYLDRYIEIINKPEEDLIIIHKHHIIPRYYFKKRNLNIDNSSKNIVKLSPANHALAHYYLIYSSIDESTAIANIHAFNKITRKQFYSMSTNNELNEILLNANVLAQLEHDYRVILNKRNNSGGCYVKKDGKSKHIKLSELESYLSNGWQKGQYQKPSIKKGTTKRMIKDGKVKNVKIDNIEAYLKLGWQLGYYKHTEEFKKKMSEREKGRRSPNLDKIVINKDGYRKYINKQDLEKYLQIGWQISQFTKYKPNEIIL